MRRRERFTLLSTAALPEAGRDVKLDINQQGNFLRVFVDGPFRHSGEMNDREDRYHG